MKDLISVIVPVYNAEKHIYKCVDSIINQTYTNLEIILVNDGSTDNCGRICDEYAQKDKRIKVIHKPNGGVSDTRNVGIDVAKGEFISFVDSDDYIELDCIKTLYEAIKDNNIDISIGAHKVIYETGIILDKSTGEKNVLNPKQVLKRILYHEGIDLSAWGKLYRTKLLKNIRYPKGRCYEDAATTYKLIDYVDKIMVTSQPIYNYIIRNDSISNNNFTIQKMDLIIATEEMCNYIKNKYPDLEKAANRRLMYAYLSTLSQLATSKEPFKEEQQIIMKYIKENGNKILLDKKAPIRDKIGIISTKLGFKFYKIMWNLYIKIILKNKYDISGKK